MMSCKLKINTKHERRKLSHSRPKPIRIEKRYVEKFHLDLRNRLIALEDQDQNNNNYINVNEMNNNIIKALVGEASKHTLEQAICRNKESHEETPRSEKTNKRQRKNRSCRVEQTNLKKSSDKTQETTAQAQSNKVKVSKWRKRN